MINYSVFHVEQFGHGKLEANDLPENKKVIINDHDGHYDVYECDSDDEAERIANWYVSAVYESYPDEAAIVKQNPRYFTVEIVECEQ